MGLISPGLSWALLLGGPRRPPGKPKQKRGRPRKPKTTPSFIAQAVETRTDGRRKYDEGDTAYVVALVDEWKASAAREQRRPVNDLSDAEALAHLLYWHARADVRKQLAAALRRLQNVADTKYQQRRAIPRAVEFVEGDLLAHWKRRLKDYRERLARKQAAAPTDRSPRRPRARRRTESSRPTYR